MAEVKPITVLHLSDIQFGKNHRFGVAVAPEGDNPYDTLRERLILDLRKLREDHGLAPDLMILTGDLAEWGKKSEFDGVLDLIVGLEKELSLARDRLIVIPGNHDINRDACEAYFKGCSADDQTPVKPYWPKWRHYTHFFGQLYRNMPKYVFSEKQHWTLFEVEPLKVVVAGLNSTIAESHKEKDKSGNFGHYGWLGEPQCQWFAEKLAKYKRDGWLRIGAVHHNVVRGAELDDENLRDASDLKRILGMHLNSVLHGHTHEADMSFWIDQNVPTLSTGSAAVNPEARPDEVPNQYQIIQFWPTRIIRYSRAYDPRGKGWIPDGRIREGAVAGRQTKQIQFQSVHAAFPHETPSGALPAESLPPEPRMNLDNELDAFTKIATGEDTETRLLLVTGEGGMGKSYLLRLYQRVAEENKLAVLFFDLRAQISVQQCFDQIISRLGYAHFLCYDAFLIQNPHEPFSPPQEESWQRNLTLQFFKDLGNCTIAYPAAILFDQYEKADSIFRNWLTQIFMPRISVYHPIIVVIAGRDSIVPPASSKGSRHFPLKSVTVDLYRRYVEECNIELDSKDIELLHEALKGQPKYFTEFVKGRHKDPHNE